MKGAVEEWPFSSSGCQAGPEPGQLNKLQKYPQQKEKNSIHHGNFARFQGVGTI